MTLFEFDEIDSTNNQARILINDGIDAPFWIIAHSQTNGRGRLDRKWQSPKGNFYCSGVISCGKNIASPLYSFIAALAVLETLKHFAPNIGAKLKWPNDILVNGAKICGILLETHNADGNNFLIIGIGVNIVKAPNIENRATTNLAEYCEIIPNLRDFVGVLNNKFAAFDAEFKKNGFEKIRNLWLDNAIGIGQNIKIDQSNRIIEGVFETLGVGGELILKTPNGQISINSGDVILPNQ